MISAEPKRSTVGVVPDGTGGASTGVLRGANPALPGTSLDTSGISHREEPCRGIVLLNREARRYLGVRCGSYDCRPCARVNRRRFVRRVRLGLATSTDPRYRPRLLTLTSPPDEPGVVAWELLTRRFQKLRQRVERRFGIKLEYAGVVEVTRAGVPHLHVIFRGPWVTQLDWSVMAQAAGFGRIVDVRKVTNEGIASYAAKGLGGYLSKGFTSHRFPRHFRRVRFSREWAPTWVPRPQAAQGADHGRWERIRPGSLDWAAYVAYSAAERVALARESSLGGQGPPSAAWWSGERRDPLMPGRTGLDA